MRLARDLMFRFTTFFTHWDDPQYRALALRWLRSTTEVLSFISHRIPEVGDWMGVFGSDEVRLLVDRASLLDE